MPINVLVLYFIFLSYQSHIFSIFSTFLLSSYIFSFSNFSFMSHLFHIKLSLLFFHFQVLSFALSHVYFCFLKACFSFFFLQYLRLYCILLFSIFSFPVLCSHEIALLPTGSQEIPITEPLCILCIQRYSCSTQVSTC